jgi:hypothetical protein
VALTPSPPPSSAEVEGRIVLIWIFVAYSRVSFIVNEPKETDYCNKKLCENSPRLLTLNTKQILIPPLFVKSCPIQGAPLNIQFFKIKSQQYYKIKCVILMNMQKHVNTGKVLKLTTV